jgi:hypothetical protein
MRQSMFVDIRELGWQWRWSNLWLTVLNLPTLDNVSVDSGSFSCIHGRAHTPTRFVFVFRHDRQPTIDETSYKRGLDLAFKREAHTGRSATSICALSTQEHVLHVKMSIYSIRPRKPILRLWGCVAQTTEHTLSANVATNFADKRL